MELRNLHADIQQAGFRLIGLSPDLPEKAAETAKKRNLSFELLSHPSMEAAQKLGIAWELGAEMVAKFLEYGLDIERDSGETHHQLPVPAVFVLIDGVVHYQHIDPDHTQRLPSPVLKAMVEHPVEEKK